MVVRGQLSIVVQSTAWDLAILGKVPFLLVLAVGIWNISVVVGRVNKIIMWSAQRQDRWCVLSFQQLEVSIKQ